MAVKLWLAKAGVAPLVRTLVWFSYNLELLEKMRLDSRMVDL